MGGWGVGVDYQRFCSALYIKLCIYIYICFLKSAFSSNLWILRFRKWMLNKWGLLSFILRNCVAWKYLLYEMRHSPFPAGSPTMYQFKFYLSINSQLHVKSNHTNQRPIILLYVRSWSNRFYRLLTPPVVSLAYPTYRLTYHRPNFIGPADNITIQLKRKWEAWTRVFL